MRLLYGYDTNFAFLAIVSIFLHHYKIYQLRLTVVLVFIPSNNQYIQHRKANHSNLTDFRTIISISTVL